MAKAFAELQGSSEGMIEATIGARHSTTSRKPRYFCTVGAIEASDFPLLSKPTFLTLEQC